MNVIPEASMGRLSRLLERLPSLSEDLRTMFVSTIVHGKSKATVCADRSIDGHAFDQTYSQMLREIKREPASDRGKPAQLVTRLRFPVPPQRP